MSKIMQSGSVAMPTAVRANTAAIVLAPSATRSRALRNAISVALTSAAFMLPLQAAHAQQADTEKQLEEIVVTGFRESLSTALAEKRNETAAIDSIVAEDIGKFPDSNLAESMQRIPGVTLSRGDGGEGRNISVRGLGPGFTRVRINGMEGASQTGSTDIFGAGNNGRSFDFNAFPSEIFSSLSVRKTPSADVEEGSLGATVDLRAPRPFDYSDEGVFTVTTRGAYNTVAEDLDPRMSMLGSKTFRDGTFGVLGSFAYQNRHLREVGYSAVDILSANSNALDIDGPDGPALPQPFCTPIGFTPVSPSPVAQGGKGATDTMCSTNNPRRSDLDAYNTVYNLRRADMPDVPGSGAFLPRLPRYVNSEQEAERIAGTLSFQWAPSENTTVSLDTLYSKFDVVRTDNYLAAHSFGRNVNNNGQPMVSVRDIEFDENGSLVYGAFDGVDVRSEGHYDHFTTEFEQINLDIDHRFSDAFAMQALVGYSESTFDSPIRLQTFIDVLDADNVVIDFRGGRSSPLIDHGVDVSDPANFHYGPGAADGTVTGGFSSYGRPSINTTKNTTAELNGTLNFTEAVAVKVGAQYRESDFTGKSTTLLDNAIQPLPDGTSITDITSQVTGADDYWSGAPASWTAVDPDKWRRVFGFDSFDYCGAECGASENQIVEEVQSGYFMLTFDSADWLPIPVRGDVGVRYVHTNQTAVGYIPINAPPGSPYQRVGQRNEVDRSYEDWLPSANIVFELTPDLLARVSGSKVMSRPELGQLVPNSTVNGITRTGSVNNPFLDPIRAKTFDLALEWYFREGSLLSLAYFYKDIETFIQRRTEQTPFRDLGLPDSLLENTAAVPTDIFTVNRISNTPGGPLEGFELNAQVQLSFLPGFWSNFGVLANYTHVTSEIEYILRTEADGTIVTTTDDLTGLSRDSASGTLYYENDRFSIRTTSTYRGKYIRGIPASPGSDLQGNKSTLYVDASASYNINDNFNLILEAQNLTDERNVLYIDSVREDTLYETTVGRTYTVGASYRF